MPEQVPRKRTVSRIPAMLLLVLVVVCSLPIAFDLVRSLGSLVGDESRAGFGEVFLSTRRLTVLVRSILIASGISIIGVCMGIPLGRVLAGRLHGRARILAAMLISPIWFPATMVYAAGNLLRAPDTIVGGWLVSYSTSSADLRWVTIWVGYGVAVLGLAVWSAPLAAVLIASGLGVRSNLYDEMIALEPVGVIRRGWLWIRIHQSVLLRAWLLIAVIMFGSAVPMHLAQLDTWSIIIWRQLSELGPSQWGSVWLSSWPTVVVAGLGAWVLTRAVVRPQESSPSDDRGHSRQSLSKAVVALAVLVWVLGALVPLLAMVFTLDDLGSILQFWKIQGGAVQDSGLIAIGTGLITMLIAVGVANVMGNSSIRVRRLGAISVLVLCTLGLIPGVLVGAAVARFPVQSLTSSWVGAFIASCIRAGFLGAIIGSLCARTESIERQSIRWQLAGDSLWAWFTTRMPSIGFPVLGAGLVGLVYSFSEIEAAVIVRSPSMRNLPQQLLSDMHYARLEQLNAAGINLMAVGVGVCVVGSLLLMKIED